MRRVYVRFHFREIKIDSWRYKIDSDLFDCYRIELILGLLDCYRIELILPLELILLEAM